MDLIQAMSYTVKPYQHQIDAMYKSLKLNDMALFWEMGCICAQTLITINIGGASKTIPIKEVYERYRFTPFKIRSFVDGEIRLHTALAVGYSGIKKTYRVTLANGMKINVTDEHKFLTINGWECIKDGLKSNVCVSENKLPITNKGRINKERYNELVVGPYHPFSWKSKNRHGTIVNKKQKHILIVEAGLNNMSLTEFIDTTYGQNFLKFIDSSIFHIHHIDGNSKNNDVDNLELLSREEHYKLHGYKNYKNFNNFEPTYSPIVDIEASGERHTYDICCEDPHNNYVANGIVVHNTGKTGGVINILRTRYAINKRLMRTLILGPVAVVHNWKKEFLMHAPKINQNNIFVCEGSSKRFLDTQKFLVTQMGTYRQDGIVITNYEGFRNEKLFDLILKWNPEIIVCDESHMLKNHKAEQSKNVYKISCNATSRFILTGTPILNSPMDIFQQFKILDNGKTFGQNFFVFRQTYFRDDNAGWSNKPGHFPKFTPIEEKFGELTNKIYTKAIRILKKDCLDLPERIEMVHPVEMSEKQRVAYEQMKRDFVTWITDIQTKESKAVIAQLAVTKALRLQQIVSGHATSDDGTLVDLGDIPRIHETEKLLMQLVDNHKVILWCCFIHDVSILEKICKKNKVKYTKIVGGMTAQAKQDAIDALQNDKDTRVMIANRRAGGTGTNMTQADYSIVYSRNFSLAEENQSKDRNHRGGSEIHEKIIKIDLCATGTIDELVIDALKNKQNISDIIIDWRDRL